MIERTTRDLLEKVNLINKKYDEIAEVTGEKFNIFNILKVERSEVHTHSAILGELLDVKGSHGQKNVFLNLFLAYLKSLQTEFVLENFVSEQSNTVIEKYIGCKDELEDNGGRIDIFIESNKTAIIIENKIDAGDQNKQLLRYYNYGKSNFQEDFLLIYLTKDGKSPESSTTGSIGVARNKTISISYERHIIEWLELCKKEASSLPILRETITQYINLIKKITHQTINQKMSDDINRLLTVSVDNFNAAETIAKEIQKAKEKIFKHYWDEVLKQIREFLGADWLTKDLSGWGKLIYKENCEILGFCFDRVWEKNIHLGIVKNPIKNDENQSFRQLSYKETFNSKAQLYMYQHINDLWIDRPPISTYEYIFDEKNLRQLLPLNELISNSPLVCNLVNEFKVFATEKRNEDYINEVYGILRTDYEFLSVLKNSISNSNIIESKIYQKFVLFYNLSVAKNCTLAIDVYKVDKKVTVEVFVRSGNLDQIKQILIQSQLSIENLSFREHRLIYRVFENPTVEEVSNVLQDLISNLSKNSF